MLMQKLWPYVCQRMIGIQTVTYQLFHWNDRILSIWELHISTKSTSKSISAPENEAVSILQRHIGIDENI